MLLKNIEPDVKTECIEESKTQQDREQQEADREQDLSADDAEPWLQRAPYV